MLQFSVPQDTFWTRFVKWSTILKLTTDVYHVTNMTIASLVITSLKWMVVSVVNF